MIAMNTTTQILRKTDHVEFYFNRRWTDEAMGATMYHIVFAMDNGARIYPWSNFCGGFALFSFVIPWPIVMILFLFF